jgi:ethanolamine permease
MSDAKPRMVHYEDVDQQYLERRKLKPSAGWILLAAMGVGAVISGDFFGWHFGLKYGFRAMAIATVAMATMYFCMVYTIAELSACLPHAGGFFSFTRNAFGPLGGFICGLTDTIEYVLTPAVIVTAISGYLTLLMYEGSTETAPFWVTASIWVCAYLFFVGINIRGASLTLRMGLVITALAAAVLVIFYAGALASDSFDFQAALNTEPEEGGAFPISGIFAALPFAIWFYLAIEQLPLAAEESDNAATDMPRALVVAMFILFVLSILTLVINAGVGGGARELIQKGSFGNNAPLAYGIREVFGSGWFSKGLVLLAVSGLIASFHATVYAYGRVLFALSRAGYIPRWLSLTGKNKTPYLALLSGAVIGLICATLITLFDEGASVGAVLLNMAVFGAVISYAMVMASYIKLRISRPDLERPYRSPLGIPGAVIGLLLSVIALVSTFLDKEYRPGVYGVAIFLGAGIIYFFVYSRHHLVAQAPEEEVALISQAKDKLSG